MKDERTGQGYTDMTPERLREMRERCERATPGPWRRWAQPEGVKCDWKDALPPGSICLESTGTIFALGVAVAAFPGGHAADLDFAAHAREDLPAALAEIERLQRERDGAREDADKISGQMVALHAAYDDQVSRIEAKLDAATAEIERLTAELAARVPALFDGPPRTLYQPNGPDGQPEDAGAPADASLEARAEMVKEVLRASGVGLLVTHPSDGPSALQAVVRAVDASRPAAPTPERTFPRVTLSTVTPGSLVEIASGDICLVLDGCYGEAPRYVVWVATGRTDTMPASATVSLRATPAELDVLTSADASRPGLTERDAADIELARAVRDTLRETTHDGAIERLEELLDVEKEAAARPGLTEEQAREIAADVAASFNARWSIGLGQGPLKDMADRIEAGVLRPSRGTTGLTEEARHDFEVAVRDAAARGGPYCVTHTREAVATLDAALRASRGEAGPATEPTRAERVAEAQRLRAEARAEAEACTVPMPADLLARYPRSADPPEPDRPADLGPAMHAAQQRPSAPTDLGPGIGGAPIRIRPTVLTASAVEEWPEPELSGLTCPGCYAATGIAQPHDPRAALHEDDPERKTATLAGGGTGND